MNIYIYISVCVCVCVRVFVCAPSLSLFLCVCEGTFHWCLHKLWLLFWKRFVCLTIPVTLKFLRVRRISSLLSMWWKELVASSSQHTVPQVKLLRLSQSKLDVDRFLIFLSNFMLAKVKIQRHFCFKLVAQTPAIVTECNLSYTNTSIEERDRWRNSVCVPVMIIKVCVLQRECMEVCGDWKNGRVKKKHLGWKKKNYRRKKEGVALYSSLPLKAILTIAGASFLKSHSNPWLECVVKHAFSWVQLRWEWMLLNTL